MLYYLFSILVTLCLIVIVWRTNHDHQVAQYILFILSAYSTIAIVSSIARIQRHNLINSSQSSSLSYYHILQKI